jgi:hypothetical protein
MNAVFKKNTCQIDLFWHNVAIFVFVEKAIWCYKFSYYNFIDENKLKQYCLSIWGVFVISALSFFLIQIFQFYIPEL